MSLSLHSLREVEEGLGTASETTSGSEKLPETPTSTTFLNLNFFDSFRSSRRSHDGLPQGFCLNVDSKQEQNKHKPTQTSVRSPVGPNGDNTSLGLGQTKPRRDLLFSSGIVRAWRLKKSRILISHALVDKCPKGYPRLAAFLDSDEGFAIFRRFGLVQTRLLLEKQDEMRLLEDELMEMDVSDEETKSRRLHTRAFEPKRELLQTLETTYHEYGTADSGNIPLDNIDHILAKLLCTAQQMMALNRPSSSDYESVVNYVCDRRPVVESEREWVLWKEDMVTLRPGREHAWLDAGIERALKSLHCRLIEVRNVYRRG